MGIYSPYFYIIYHKPTQKFYVGCKYAKDADPSIFMKNPGYTTSSNIVNSLINLHGLDSFDIAVLLTEDEVGDVYKFETAFLRENHIAADPQWLNCHENHLAPFGSSEFKQMMLKLHGVENGMNLDSAKTKLRLTNIEKYGVSCVMNTPENIKTRIDRQLEKHGQKNNFDKIKQTMMELYNVENPFQRGAIRDDIERKIKQIYGGMGNSSQIIAAKQKETLLKKYGVENSFQIDEVKAKIKIKMQILWNDDEFKKMHSASVKQALSTIDRNGENNSFYGKQHSDESKKKISQAAIGRKYAICSCLHCKQQIPINNITQHQRKCGNA